MSVDTLTRPLPRLRGWARDRANSHLYRNGYALIASSALTSVLGFGYWLVAAREYSPTAVGLGSALIAAMTMIADLCHLNLKSALNRFLPRGGLETRRMVVGSYLVALVVSAVASAVFVVGLGIWSPRLAFLKSRPELGLLFVLGTMAWTIFVLQDSVLTGIRQAVWVPLENLVYSVAKLALLPVLVVAPLLGTFVAWTAALPLVIAPVNVLLFRRLLPAHVLATRGREERVGVGGIARYVAGDYAAYLIMTGAIGVLPLIVLAELGAKANAYYFVSWSIAYGLYLIASGMGMSMVTEAAHDPSALGRYRRQSLVETAKLMVPCVAVVVLGAPQLLGLMGPGYASEGATLLRLLALSALPWMVWVAYTNSARVQRRIPVVVRAHLLLFGLVLAIGLPLMRSLGIVGLGIGWLAAQTIVAAAILGREVVMGWPGELEDDLVRTLSTVRNRWRRLLRVATVGTRRSMLADLRARPGCESWVVQRDLPVLNDLAVSAVGPPRSAPAAVVKRACTRAGQHSLRSHVRALLLLERIPGLAEWSVLVPRLTGVGLGRGRSFVVESYVPGVSMENLLGDGGDCTALLAGAGAAIRPLHDATSRRQSFDARLLDNLIDTPLQRLRPVVARHSRLATGLRILERLQIELGTALKGRSTTTAWVHGDLSPGNILMAGDRATGIIDWEQGRPHGLPQLDLLQLVVGTRMVIERRELGDVVAEMYRRPEWRSHEEQVARALLDRDPSLPARLLVLLTWLQHVSANIGKSSRYARSRVWVRRNIDPVLASVALGPVPVPAGVAGGNAGSSGAGAAQTVARHSTEAPATRPRASLKTLGLRLAAPVAPLCLAAVLWVLSLPQIHPREMTNLGLISVLPWTYLAALLVVVVSFVALVHRRSAPTWLLVAHLLLLIALIHGTPAIAYGTLRYEWAWKHVGIVDYIARHGTVDPGIKSLSVYHNWPGFFALITLLTKLGGLSGALSLAIWGPVFNNVLYLGALLFLFSGLTRDRRIVWISCLLFFIADWVGQDYFSPQAFSFLLYLLMLGVVVRWLGPGPRAKPPGRRAALCLAVVLLVAIAASHAFTSVMAAVALTALVVARVSDARLLPLAAAAITALWDLTFASDYAGSSLASTLDAIRLPWSTTGSSLTSYARLGPDQVLIANMARGLTIAILALAVAGAVRQLRAGKLSRAAAILAVAPVALFGTGNYDGEILFRIYLYAVPFLAFFAAHALAGCERQWRSRVITTTGALLLTGAFLFPYYGNDRLYYFTPQEVAAARYVDTHAPYGSLLIDATNNYPFAFKNYERFTYVSIAREPSPGHILANPLGVLDRWMTNPRYRAAYLILTRSQEVEVDSYGSLYRGSVEKLKRVLLASPLFRVVFRNRDAAVFTIARSTAGSVAR